MNLGMIVPGIPSADRLPLAGPSTLFHALLILTSTTERTRSRRAFAAHGRSGP